MDSVYVIARGVKPGKPLTRAQRTSSLFAEEPVVLGRVLRAGSQPLRISKEQYMANRVQLAMLEKAGAIVVTVKKGKEEALEEMGKMAAEVVKETLSEPSQLRQALEVTPVEPPAAAPIEAAAPEEAAAVEAPKVEEPIVVQEEVKVETKMGRKGRKS